MHYVTVRLFEAVARWATAAQYPVASQDAVSRFEAPDSHERSGKAALARAAYSNRLSQRLIDAFLAATGKKLGKVVRYDIRTSRDFTHLDLES